jgi:transposase
MPRPKTYVVILTDEQQAHLLGFLKQGAAKARMLTRARILLLSAAGNTDRFIADVLQVTPQTVRNIRKRFAEEGLEAALQERPRPGAQPKLDGKQEAFLVALACSAPPEGREHWTMQLLADRLVELGVVESISDETVRRRSGPDGKWLRGSKRDATDALRVVTLAGVTAGQVWAQRAVPDGDELAAALALLEAFPLEGKVISADAGLLRPPFVQNAVEKKGVTLGSSSPISPTSIRPS